MWGPHTRPNKDLEVEPAYLLLCFAGCACRGRSQWGRQGLLAEDLLVQLLCLLVLVLLQVGCGLQGGPGQGVGLLLRPGNFSDLPAFPSVLPQLTTVQSAIPKARPLATESHLCASVSHLSG